MQHLDPSPPSVVVGIDGSRAAVGAALWAVDEAVSRDIPLRLVYAIEPSGQSPVDPQTAAQQLATAEIAVRYAFTAVESTEKPVKIEVEILQNRSPKRALLEASRSAAMLCVGSIGLKHATQGRVGSTAAALAESAHCPVAIVGGYHPSPARPGWVVAEMDGSFASGCVLQRGIDEALLRGAPLRVLTSWQSRFTDAHDSQAVADGNRMAKADLERRLAVWRRRYPDLDIESVIVHAATLTYLARNAKLIQLLVVARGRVHGFNDVLGPIGQAVLNNSHCSFLIAESQNVL
jgi:nucleotide-binding universal stress UspA family protein